MSATVSIIVNNFNYGRFVGQAIESALQQDWSRTEVIVVDDGSTDNSREVINRFGNRVRVEYKSNAGQASAFNHGFEVAGGDVVIFLDADDALAHTAARWAAETCEDSSCSKATWQMRVLGPDGGVRDQLLPAHPPEAGELLPRLAACGPFSFRISPCSGNAWPRRFLERVMPVPPEPFRRGADGYLLNLSPVYGRTVVASEPHGFYRLHGSNFLASKSEFEIRDVLRSRYHSLAKHLAEHLKKRGAAYDRSTWNHEHWDRLDELARELATFVPPAEAVIVVDEDILNLGQRVLGRPRHHLLERNGAYWGSPATGQEAISQISAHLTCGTRYVVFVWYSFWWLEHYPELLRVLETHAVEIHESRVMRAFRLSNGSPAAE